MTPEIIQDIPLSLTKEGLFRRMGYGGRDRPPAQEILDQFDRAMDLVKTQTLLNGRCVLLIQEISSITKEGVETQNGCKIPGKRIFSLMPHASHLAMAIGTIGDDLETLSRKFVKYEDPLIGIMLDSIGSAAVDCLVEEISKYISDHATKLGLMSSSPISPGMPGLPLETQKILFDYLPANKISMQLTRSNMMIPFKSSSMLFGIGKAMPTWSKKKMCKACHLFKHCRYKILN